MVRNGIKRNVAPQQILRILRPLFLEPKVVRREGTAGEHQPNSAQEPVCENVDQSKLTVKFHEDADAPEACSNSSKRVSAIAPQACSSNDLPKDTTRSALQCANSAKHKGTQGAAATVGSLLGRNGIMRSFVAHTGVDDKVERFFPRSSKFIRFLLENSTQVNKT